MNLFDEKTDELLAKHLAGELEPAEAEWLARWLQESPEHRKYLEDLQWLWAHSPGGKTPAPRAVDTEQALQSVKSRMAAGRRVSMWSRVAPSWRAAAVLALALTAWLWWRRGDAAAPSEIAAAQSALHTTLSDGSVVRLEPNSALRLAAGFNRRERRMRMRGLASFEVRHDTGRPFIVEVSDLQVRVVGTEFRVDNTTDPSTVFVYVSKGKVELRHGAQTLLLGAGEAGAYDISQKTLLRRTPAQGAPSGKGRQFQFEATRLAEVVRRLSEAYGVPVSLKNKNLENCPLTAPFNNLPLERVLEIIAETFPVRVEKTAAGGYVLDGQGCE